MLYKLFSDYIYGLYAHDPMFVLTMIVTLIQSLYATVGHFITLFTVIAHYFYIVELFIDRINNLNQLCIQCSHLLRLIVIVCIYCIELLHGYISIGINKVSIYLSIAFNIGTHLHVCSQYLFILVEHNLFCM